MKTKGGTRTKRMAAVLLVLIMTVALMTALAMPTAAATSGSCGDNLTWTLDDSGTLTISGTGAMADYEYDMPWYDFTHEIETIIIGNDVTTIGAYAFAGCYNVTAVTIPQGVTKIGEAAFIECYGITAVTIPDSVTIIGKAAFYCCEELTSITLGKNVTTIGKDAFLDCYNLCAFTVDQNNSHYASEDGVLFNKNKTALIQYPYSRTESTYKIPDSVTVLEVNAFRDCNTLIELTLGSGMITIGERVFWGCYSLSSITIPKNVTNIDCSAFNECYALKQITVDNDNAVFTSVDGVLYTKDMKTLLRYPEGKTETEDSFVVPNTVTKIGEGAFYNISHFDFPYSDDAKAEKVTLRSITLSNNTEEIGAWAFTYCVGLESILIPDSVTCMGKQVFAECEALTEIILGKGMTSIPEEMFVSCDSLARVTVPDSVKMIERGAFAGCKSLKNIHISKAVDEIGEAVFSTCESLQSISVDESNAAYLSIDGNLYTKDKSILLQYALGKEDTFFAVPDGVKSIGAYAFAESPNLSMITMPNSVTQIGKYAFSDCVFEAICLSNALTSIEEGVFQGCELWNGIVAIPKSVKSIGKNAFRHCWDISEIKIQGNEISIEDDAFNGAENLETVFFGGTEEEWENVQFGSGNEFLTRADIYYGYGDAVSGTCGEELTWSVDGNGLLTISGVGCMEFEGRRAPWYEIRDRVRAVSVSENVESICYRAFADCYYIETVEVLGSVIEIEESAFENCLSLRSIQLPEEIDRIYDSTFYCCKSLQSIEIPETVKRIDDGAFSGCKNLKSIEISKNVEQIGGSAFANSSLESISVAEDNPYYCALNGSLYTKDKTEIMQYAGSKTETVFIVPDGVTEIASGAFGGAEHLINIILPATLEFIGDSAFYNCYGLTNIVIPSGVTEIGGSAFESCINLKKIEIPFSVTYIGEYAFFFCRGLTDVVYEGSRELWTEIEFGEENDALLNASIQYQNLNIYVQYDIKTDKLLIIGNDNIEKDEALLLVAAYKDNAVFSGKTMISCKTMIVPILTGESIVRNLLQNMEDADRIQFMLWDGTSMMPLAKAIEKKY